MIYSHQNIRGISEYDLKPLEHSRGISNRIYSHQIIVGVISEYDIQPSEHSRGFQNMI